MSHSRNSSSRARVRERIVSVLAFAIASAGGSSVVAQSTGTRSLAGLPGPSSLDSLIGFEDTKLLAADGKRYARFGGSVAIEGDLAVVGAAHDWSPEQGAGSAYVYRYDVVLGWQEEQKLVGSGQRLSAFGGAVSISGGRLLIGAHGEGDIVGHDQGAGYVFAHDGGGWILEARLDHSGGYDFANLGRSVALSGNLAVLGAPLEFDGGIQAGAVRVFSDATGAWSPVQMLTPSDGEPGDTFGSSVATDGQTIVVGAPGKDLAGGRRGVVYVFELGAGSWQQVAQLALPQSEPYHYVDFGASVDVQGDTLVVGVPSYGAANLGAGLVSVYRRTAGTWAESTRLEASAAGIFGNFGVDVELDGERLAVGSRGWATPDLRAGAAYAFRRMGPGEWQEIEKLVASDATEGDRLGESVGISGTRFIAGAEGCDDFGPSSGAAYVFEVVDPASVGTAFCLGDGSGAPCPCGNESAVGEGGGCASSAGHGARLLALGSASVTSVDLGVFASGLPPRTSCMLFGGTATVSGGSGAPFGDGLSCVGGPLVRIGSVLGGAVGVVSWDPDVAGVGGWVAGETIYLQAWYRDSGGPCGSGFNTTGALEVQFTP